MRALGIFRYHWLRNRSALIILFAIMLAISVGTSLFLMHYTAATVSMEMTGEGVEVYESHADMSAFSDPDTFTSLAIFEWAMLVFALMLVGKERKYLVTMSAARWEILLGNGLFLLSLAAAMALSVWFLNVVGRAVLWIVGFRVRDGWNVKMLLWANNPLMGQKILLHFSQLVFEAGMFTLIGHLFSRWRKQILILFGVCVALGITLIVQLNFGYYVKNIEDFLKFVEWAVYTLEPVIKKLFYSVKDWAFALRQIVVGLLLTLVSYPIMRRVAVR